MAKKICTICKKEIGFLEKTKILDGYVCYDCIDKSGLRKCMGLANLSFTSEQIRRTIAGELKPEKPIKYSIGNNLIYINRPANTWMTKIGQFIPGHKMDDIISYEYIENDKKYSIAKTVGTAAVGGLLFGGVGALVGGLIGNNQKRTIKTAAIYVIEKSGTGFVRSKIPLVTHDDSPIKEGTKEYSKLISIIESVGTFFDKAIEENNKQENLTKSSISINKSLLDETKNITIETNDYENQVIDFSTENKNQSINPPHSTEKIVTEKSEEQPEEAHNKEKAIEKKTPLTYKKYESIIMWSLCMVLAILGIVALSAAFLPWALGWLCASFIICPKFLTTWSFKKRLIITLILLFI